MLGMNSLTDSIDSALSRTFCDLTQIIVVAQPQQLLRKGAQQGQRNGTVILLSVR